LHAIQPLPHLSLVKTILLRTKHEKKRKKTTTKLETQITFLKGKKLFYDIILIFDIGQMLLKQFGTFPGY